MSGHVSSTSLLVQSNPSSLRRCREENDIFRYFDDMQSIIRSRKDAINSRKRRKRNLSFDLVGVELNPGPNPPKKSRASKAQVMAPKKKVKKGAATRSRGTDALNQMSNVSKQYMATVLAPCAGNARIPDMNCVDTFLASVDFEFNFPTNAQGCGGICFPLPAANTVTSNFNVETSASTDSIIAYSPTGIVSGLVGLATNCSSSRLVSACVDTFYTGSSNNDSGYVIGSFSGRTELFNSGTLPASLGQIANTRTNSSHRIKDGMTVVYRPTDGQSFDFLGTSSTAYYGTFVLHVSGAATAVSMRTRIRLNYECIPLTDTNDYTTGVLSSVIDPVGLSHAVNTMRVTPNIMPVQESKDITTTLSKIFTTAVKYGPEIYAGVQSARQIAGMLL